MGLSFWTGTEKKKKKKNTDISFEYPTDNLWSMQMRAIFN